MQTPHSALLSGPISASFLSRQPSESHSAPGSLHRATCSTSSLASESLHSVLQHNPPLRRTASELSERPSPTASRYISRQSNRAVLSPTTPPLSHSSSASERVARRFAPHVAGTSHDFGDVPARLSDALQSRGDSFMSSDELLAFREFLARRAEAVLTEKRNFATSPVSDQHHGIRKDRNSLSSDRQFSLHGGASHPVYGFLHPDTTSVSTSLESLDAGSTKSDLLRALSIIRAERKRVSSDDDSLLASGDTLLDLYARSSSSASPIQSESSPFGNLHASRPECHTGSRPQSTDPLKRAATASICIEEMQDFLPDFLDLYSDVDPPESATNELSSSESDSLPFLARHKRLASVPEGSAADPYRQRNQMQLEEDQGDPSSAKLPPVNHLGPRRTHSDAGRNSSRSQFARPLPSSKSYTQPWNGHNDLLHDDPEGRRGYHRRKPDPATDSAEMIGDEGVPRRYDSGTNSLAEFAELAYSQSIAEPDSRWPGDSGYTRRVEAKRTRDSRQRKPSLRIALDSSSPREFLPREAGQVFQRQRAMTLQEFTASEPPTQDRLHRSASVTSTLSRSSSHTGARLRTLRDRAYRHPDVPRSPLFFDLDHPSVPNGACHIAPPAREPFSRHDMHDLRVSSRETGNTLTVPSYPHSAVELYSRNASPRLSRPRPHMPSGHGRKESYPVRERPTQPIMRRSGSSPELRLAASGLPSSTQGVGLSLVDNGAFEAPRRAPEPRSHSAHDKASVLSRIVQRGAPVALKKSADDDAALDSYLPVDAASTVFSALSLRRHVWPRKQKHESRSDSPAGHSHEAGSSESGWQSSFMSVADDDVKPQRKGLFKKKI
jgi:hypothetical protein